MRAKQRPIPPEAGGGIKTFGGGIRTTFFAVAMALVLLLAFGGGVTAELTTDDVEEALEGFLAGTTLLSALHGEGGGIITWDSPSVSGDDIAFTGDWGTGDGGGIITTDLGDITYVGNGVSGGGIITMEGGGIITTYGGGIITVFFEWESTSGGGIITWDYPMGGGIITYDGGGIITTAGGGIITTESGSGVTYGMTVPTTTGGGTITWDAVIADNFEAEGPNPGYWEVLGEGTMEPSTTYVNGGSQSLHIVEGSDTGTDRHGIKHDFDTAVQGTFVVYMYDDMVNEECTFRVGDGSTFYYIKNRPWFTGDNYFVRPGTNDIDSGVERSQGWHKFELRVTNTGTTPYIDNVAAGAELTTLTDVTQVRIYVNWDSDSEGWFDDFEFIPGDDSDGGGIITSYGLCDGMVAPLITLQTLTGWGGGIITWDEPAWDDSAEGGGIITTEGCFGTVAEPDGGGIITFEGGELFGGGIITIDGGGIITTYGGGIITVFYEWEKTAGGGIITWDYPLGGGIITYDGGGIITATGYDGGGIITQTGGVDIDFTLEFDDTYGGGIITWDNDGGGIITNHGYCDGMVAPLITLQGLSGWGGGIITWEEPAWDDEAEGGGIITVEGYYGTAADPDGGGIITFEGDETFGGGIITTLGGGIITGGTGYKTLKYTWEPVAGGGIITWYYALGGGIITYDGGGIITATGYDGGGIITQTGGVDIDFTLVFDDIDGGGIITWDNDGGGIITSESQGEMAIYIDANVDNEGTANSMKTKLDSAEKAYDKDKVDTGDNIMGAFINHVEAQTGKHIDEEPAAVLIGYAQSVIASS